jgi:FlaA1/EpsC-like NDP-sugar epimerase
MGQLSRGGPLTVTHPDMKRFFMTIPEAVQLVLQASILGGNGDVFVLDMGELVLIKEFAADLIRLSGKIPEVDIKIEFTGIRPGEKLYEELSNSAEELLETHHGSIKRVIPRGSESASVLSDICKILDARIDSSVVVARASSLLQSLGIEEGQFK